MKKLFFLLIAALLSAHTFSQSFPNDPKSINGLTGLWTFNQNDHLTADAGKALVLTGKDSVIQGYRDGDKAIRIGVGNFYTAEHGIAANGGGNYVNQYTLVIDFSVPDLSTGGNSQEFRCLLQTDPANSNDADFGINRNAKLGIGESGYSLQGVSEKEWYRLVIVADLGNSFNYYLDGRLIHEGSSFAKDGRFALDKKVLFCADDNGEDNLIDVSTVAIYGKNLSAAEVAQLGGFGHEISGPLPAPAPGTTAEMYPFLQSPTPTSIYISWHSLDESSTLVEYGTSEALGQSTQGSVQDISGNKWHTVKLSSLQPNTVYYYRCSSGNDKTAINSFKTFPNRTDAKHVRFIVLGDNRTEPEQTTFMAKRIKDKLIEKYGPKWYEEFNMMLFNGDIVTNGNDITQYTREFFTPYACMSANVPFMNSIGNHEGEAANYYHYMKYEDFSASGNPLNPSTGEKYYTFTMGNCAYVATNSNFQQQSFDQVVWLTQTLTKYEQDPNIDFVFCYQHHPGHSEIWPDGNDPYTQLSLLPVMTQFKKVSMLSYGHSHNYERGMYNKPLSIFAPTEPQMDMRLLLSGGAGSSLDRWGMYGNQTDYPEIHRALDYYCYVLVDVDVAAKSYTCETYSFGHFDKPSDNALVDSWHMRLNQAAPDKPFALRTEPTNPPTLVASKMVGVDEVMSAEFQVTSLSDIYAQYLQQIGGDIQAFNEDIVKHDPSLFNTPLVSVTRDWESLYGDSGAPDYIPTNKNAGIDLSRYQLTKSDEKNILPGEAYIWRMRYRDQNAKWSEWSDVNVLSPLTRPTAINNVLDTKQLSITPNPVNEQSALQFNLKENTNLKVEILNLEGQVISTLLNSTLPKGEQRIVLNEGRTLSAGQYFARISGKGILLSKAFTVSE